MPLYPVNKLETAQLVAAAKESAAHLSRLTIEAGQRRQSHHGRVAFEAYGRVRRLRDYLRRCLSGFAEVIEIDLCEEDANLLVSCLVFAVDHDGAAPAGTPAPATDSWGSRVRELRVDLARRLATRRYRPLPGGAAPSAETRMVITEIDSDIISRRCSPAEAAAPAPSVRRPPAAATGAVPQAGGTALAELTPAAAAAARVRVGPAATADVIDARLLRDHRLRTLVGLDLRAYRRACEARDHRLAVVHLGSVFESMVLDLALPQAETLGLDGLAAGWDLVGVAQQVFADSLADTDIVHVRALLSARNAMSPARQIHRPSVATAHVVGQLADFVRRCASAAGYVAQAA